MRRSLFAFAIGCAVGAAGLWGWNNFGGHFTASTPYAGQQERAISSLSADDIKQLQSGAGWGLAKPAELNEYPGPAHILELADELDLSADQKSKVEAAFAVMQEKAKALGASLIAAERALDDAFRSGVITQDILEQRIAVAESSRAALRQVHLAAHLEVTPLLSAGQKTRYAALRGYGAHSSHQGH